MSSLVLEPDMAQVRRARSFAADQCRSARVNEDAADTAVLLVSELVTNALLHAETEARLRMRVVPNSVYAEIADDARSLPVLQPASSESTHGRGLSIVDMLADSWGVKQDADDGKIVWFELLCESE